jgi:hypothetical protein
MQMHEFQCGATNRPFLAGAAGSGLISLNFAKSKSSTHLLDITAPLKIGLDVSSTFKAHSFDDRLKAPTSPPVKTSKDEITGQQLNCEKPWQIYNNDPNAVGELESLPPITKKPQALTQDFDTEAAASFLRKPDSLLSQTKASSRAIAPSGITNFSWARKLWKAEVRRQEGLRLERPGASLPCGTGQSAASHPRTELPIWMPSVLQVERAGGNRDRAQ